MIELSAFKGRWQVSRLTVPHSGPQARFSGTATFVHPGKIEDANRLIYEERGLLTLEGSLGQGAAPMEASRRYEWRDLGHGIDVHFEDGRFFHTVPFEGQEAHHWCDPDDYRVTYDFDQWPSGFKTVWRVKGPRKEYVMHTSFTRD